MAVQPLPVKTPEGQAELTYRHRKLGQRQRTLLLLVDGRRNEGEVRRMAAQAGVPEGCFEELCALGLIAVPGAPSRAAAPAPVPVIAAGAPKSSPLPLDTGPTPLAAAASTSDPDEMSDSAFERELDAVMARTDGAADAARNDAIDDATHDVATDVDIDLAHDDDDDTGDDDPPLPAALALEPDEGSADWRGAVSLIRPNGLMDLDNDADDAFDEARALLVRAVRDAAPVAGSFTLIRLRRARTRADLVVLLDDVGSRLLRPPGAASGARTMRRVRELLELPDLADRSTDS